MYYPYSDNKGADQLCGYREADLRLCFRICKKAGFLTMRIISFLVISEANDDNDTSAHDEIDAIADNIDDDDDLLHLSADNSDSSVGLLITENKKRKMNKHQKNMKRSAKKNNQISDESDDSDMLDDFGNLNDGDHIPHKQSDSNRKRKVNVTFKTPEPCDSAKKGKVRPSQSTTGKGPAKQGKGEASDRGRGKGLVRKGRRGSMEEVDGSFRVDQTLAGSFTDVGDVFGRLTSEPHHEKTFFHMRKQRCRSAMQ